MPHNQSLKLKVAGRKDFLVPALLISVLILISAIISPQPLLMTLFVTLLLGVGWYLFTLSFSQMTGEQLTSIIFPDGSVTLESTGNIKIEGVVDGQQWCTSKFAVLKIVTTSKHQRLVVLAMQQNAGDYRRLMVWLRQDLLLKSEGRVQS
jgi:hypothetical protein